ncbi:hypothetical protein D3C76_748400 [compost metagenome]
MDHRVRRGQVEADAAGLQADQEQRHAAFLEILHRLAPVAAVALQQRIVDAALAQGVADQGEHRGELREHQHAAAFREQLFEHVHQVGELARGDRLRRLAGAGFLLHQADVAADLAQLEQCFKDDDAATRQAAPGDFLADFLVQRQAHGLVEVALRLAEFDVLDEFALRR